MKRVWSGQPVSEYVGPIGPPVVSPNGPEILIGGYWQKAMRRVGKWGDGYIGGISGPTEALELYHKAVLEFRKSSSHEGGESLFEHDLAYEFDELAIFFASLTYR
jgi:hypothetical protein